MKDHFPPLHKHLASLGLIDAENQARGFRPTRPEQSRQPNDFFLPIVMSIGAIEPARPNFRSSTMVSGS
jgi:hypothetical protein